MLVRNNIQLAKYVTNTILFRNGSKEQMLALYFFLKDQIYYKSFTGSTKRLKHNKNYIEVHKPPNYHSIIGTSRRRAVVAPPVEEPT